MLATPGLPRHLAHRHTSALLNTGVRVLLLITGAMFIPQGRECCKQGRLPLPPARTPLQHRSETPSPEGQRQAAGAPKGRRKRDILGGITADFCASQCKGALGAAGPNQMVPVAPAIIWICAV